MLNVKKMLIKMLDQSKDYQENGIIVEPVNVSISLANQRYKQVDTNIAKGGVHAYRSSRLEPSNCRLFIQPPDDYGHSFENVSVARVKHNRDRRHDDLRPLSQERITIPGRGWAVC